MLVAFLNKLVTFRYSRCSLLTTQIVLSKICNFSASSLSLFIYIITQDGRRVLILDPRDSKDTVLVNWFVASARDFSMDRTINMLSIKQLRVTRELEKEASLLYCLFESISHEFLMVEYTRG